MFSPALDLAFLGAFLLSPSAATPVAQRSITGALRVSTTTARAFAPAAPISQTENYAVLQRSKGTPRSAAYLQAMRHARNGGSSPLIPEGGGEEYLIDIQFNNVDVKVIVDTGSSDTWLIESGFRCVNISGAAQNESACGFGAMYPSSFGANQIKNTNLNISYGDGEFVTGDFGTADITVAGITVPQQTAALGTYAYWNGDGVSAGLLGLAYDALTSQYSGTDPSVDSNANRILYNPIFTTMYKTGLTSAMFSMAIERGGAGGYIAFGGLPPINATGGWANATIQKMTLSSGSQDYAFYAMTPDGFNINGSATKTTDQYIVDSGTTLLYAPSAIAQAVNNAFNPPAVLEQGFYNVQCNATAPTTGVAIGGTTFFLNGTDLILPNGDGTCTSGVQDGGSGPYILGDVFMTNVVVVFDVGAAQLRFAAHESY